ncbi:sensor histidine kinase [Pedobacter miscanthi]|uniref:histidine kinase n=1 Tax=Pedobacter miscanthi TaxID=2259170 RepID=A0A366KMA6_9SPHI|nr:sensor histidine kinase [Pedobacter miscanthi]RBQ02827.1 hypothetical protein DRW42_24565 [Pedobacter miscanthi]
MQQIPFKVSARTAKLIGQQNFTNPEGATIELVKNAYDADANNCLIIFDIVCESVPETLSFDEYEHINDSSNIKEFYKKNDEGYILDKGLKQSETRILQKYFFRDNAIYLIDNGTGMDGKTIANHWMEIGTGNKEVDYVSNGGRVKTGAKGIGRFALDRLGSKTEMFTSTKTNEHFTNLFWEMDWEQFEVGNLAIGEITSTLTDRHENLQQYLKLSFIDKDTVRSYLKSVKFESGTAIKITELKDSWSKENIRSVYNSLEALVPPKELKIPFHVACISQQSPDDFGEVQTSFLNDYDTKVVANFDPKTLKVEIEIERNELDLGIVRKQYSHLFTNAKPPLDLKTFEEKKFKYSRSVFELTKWENDPQNERKFQNIGAFRFSFFFLKNQISKKEGYPYKVINAKERKALIDKFGGIKIYRDSFRVRPYGENGNDWLKLGDRASQSTAGAGQRIGDWRVGANQISGLLTISRVGNSDLIDKSDRGALIENESFQVLKNLLTDIVKEFELDRTKVLHPFYLEMKRIAKEKQEREAEAEALRLAELIIEQREAQKLSAKTAGNDQSQPYENIAEELKSYQEIIQKSLVRPLQKEEEENEMSQVRTLASLGLIVTSFSHELKGVRNNLSRINHLEKVYSKLTPIDPTDEYVYRDGLELMRIFKKDSELMMHWVDYALTSIKKNKRRRRVIRLDEYFNTLISDWRKVFDKREITIELQNNIKEDYTFKAFEIDLNTIFSNLISNSIDSFHNMREPRERKLNILLEYIDNTISITYSDNGLGLPDVFKSDKDSVFLPFTTSKKDRLGNDIGTGLGMYLVKNTVNDNDGEIEIIDTNEGFKTVIKLKTN